MNSLQTKISLSLILIFFGLLIAILTYFTNNHFLNKSINEKINILAINEINKKESDFSDFIKNKSKYLNILKDSTIFNRYLDDKIKTENKFDAKDLFKVIFESDKSLMQLRFINKNGFEDIKIFRDKNTKIEKFTLDEDLQDKSDRYYFKETKQTPLNKTWVSSLDLNVENHKVQKPLRPTLRLSTSIYKNNNFEGILIINIDTKDFLNSIIHSDIFKISLIDNSGNFIKGKKIVNDTSIDLSWSKYLNKAIDFNKYLPFTSQKILEQKEFTSDKIFSKNISSSVFLPEGLILVLEPLIQKIDSLNSEKDGYLIYESIIILLISIPLAFFLGNIPSNMISKLGIANDRVEESDFELEQYKKAIDQSNIVSKSDLNGNITYVNDKFCEISLYKREEVIGKPHSILRGEISKDKFDELWKVINNKGTWKGILVNKKKNGDLYHINITILPILDRNGNIVEYIAIRHDVTELVEKTKVLEKILREDYLTKEGNRFKLLEDIKKAKKPYFALLNINSFSQINDFYGHVVGDRILKLISKRIKNLLASDKYSFYRLHSDEFAVLCDKDSKENFVACVTAISKDLASHPFLIAKKEIFVTISVSISYENKVNLISSAGIVKKLSKTKQEIIVYDKGMNLEKVYEKNIEWTFKIKKALEEDRFVPFYQPIYNMKTNKIEKYECLIRLMDENDVAISPYFFLDIAKKSKQYLQLTKKVIEVSFEYFKDIDKEFSINLTIEDITSKSLSNFILEQLKKYNNAHKVVFELVESEGINNFDEVNSFIDKVKDLGCRIAIDDFGTGYSNFEYLIKLNVSYIKIDGSMIKDILVNKNSEEIVKTIVDFAKRQGFKTIAEFVSNEDIFNKMKELDIDYSQGYYIDEPRATITL